MKTISRIFLLGGVVSLVAATAVFAAEGNTAIQPVPRDPPWPARHESFLEIAKAGGVDVLFVGDSITDNWRVAGKGKAIWDEHFAPLHAANFGISSDRLQHILWRLQNGELEGIHPKVVVLMVGTNNIIEKKPDRPRNTRPEIIEGVAAVVQEVRTRLPESKILLLAIFPRGEKDSPERAWVGEANAGIAKLDDGQFVHFLDIGPKFLWGDGTLSRDIMPDLLHPNEAGYALWAAAIKAPLAALLK